MTNSFSLRSLSLQLQVFSVILHTRFVTFSDKMLCVSYGLNVCGLLKLSLLPSSDMIDVHMLGACQLSSYSNHNITGGGTNKLATSLKKNDVLRSS